MRLFEVSLNHYLTDTAFTQVYQYLKNQKAGILGLTRIKWNFEVSIAPIHLRSRPLTPTSTEIPRRPPGKCCGAMGIDYGARVA